MNNTEIDKNKLNAMYSEIRALEATNLRTGENSDTDMVKKIMNIIHRRANSR